MTLVNLYFTSRAFDKIQTHCAVAMTFSDLRPLQGMTALVDWRLNGRLSKIVMDGRYDGNITESLLFPSEGRMKANEILLLGLGHRSAFNESHVAIIIGHVLEKIARMQVFDFSISLSEVIPNRFEWRNCIRLFVSKLYDYPSIQSVTFCESADCLKDARRRNMEFGPQVEVHFDTLEH